MLLESQSALLRSRRIQRPLERVRAAGQRNHSGGAASWFPYTYDRGSQRWTGTSRRDYWGPIPDKPKHSLMREDHRMAAELEFLLDQILTVLRKGKLTREGAAGRIVAQLGMSHCDVPTGRFSPQA